MATSGRGRSAGGPGVLLVSATGLAAAAVALDAGFDLPAALRAILFAAWAAAVGVLAWGSLGRSASRSWEAWAAGGAAVAAFGLVVLYVPGGARAGRLAPPWSAQRTAVRLTVTTGDPVVARGAGVTLACICEPAPPDDDRPVLLEVRGADGQARQHPAAEEVPGIYSVRLPAVGDPLTYRFVGGETTTAWHRVTPTDPVALTAATAFVAEPPTYAAGQFPSRRFTLGEPVISLAGGRVTATLTFDRPPVAVRAVWLSDGDESGQSLAVEPAADGRTAKVATDVPAAGRVVVTLTGDHDYQTVHTVPIAVVVDQPPAFLAIAGFEDGRWGVRPDESFTVTVEVSDDGWAAPPKLDLLIGSSPSATVARSTPLTSIGGGRFTGKLSLTLADSWRDGRVEVRLRLSDTLRPTGVMFPVEGWVEFHRAESAPPLSEQIVIAQRDRVAVHLASVLDVAAGGRVDRSEEVGRRLASAADGIHYIADLDPLAHELRSVCVAAARLNPSELTQALKAVQESNRRLAADRLDRLRLRELALATQAPAADAARLRDRLAAVIAASPRLSAARAAAEQQALTAAVNVADRLADDMDRAADLLTASRAARLQPLVETLNRLTAEVGAANAEWAAAGRLVAKAAPADERLQRASRLLLAARPADALPVLDTTSRQLADLATAFTQAADARGDPREAARQLVRWRADLDARPGPPPADELNHWHASARTLATIARVVFPSGADTPDRIAREFPTPAELKRSAANELRECYPRPADALKPSDLTLLATRLDALPPPAESRSSRLAAAVARRAATTVEASRTHDTTADTSELRWRCELLAQAMGGNDATTVLDEPASSSSSDRLTRLAVRVGLPPTLGGEATALRDAVRTRIDGTDTDRQRLGHILHWWTARPAIGAEHVRELSDLLDTIRIGDVTTPFKEVRRLLQMPRRPADFLLQVANALRRLRDGLGRSADVPLADGADLSRPTAARRLIDLDAGGRLPSHRQADVARRLAERVVGLARDVAATSAALQTDAVIASTRAALNPSLVRLEQMLRRPGTPVGLTDHWPAVVQGWSGGSDAVEVFQNTARSLRLLMCVFIPAPTPAPADIERGRELALAGDTLDKIVSAQTQDVKSAWRTVATALESAAR